MVAAAVGDPRKDWSAAVSCSLHFRCAQAPKNLLMEGPDDDDDAVVEVVLGEVERGQTMEE